MLKALFLTVRRIIKILPVSLFAVCMVLSPSFAVENTAPLVSSAIASDFFGYDDYGQSIAVQSDGKVLVGGWAFDGTKDLFAIVRYNADGSPDTAFGVAGKVTADFWGGSEYRNDLALQDDGKILVAGNAYNGPEQNPQQDFAIARYNSAGNLDTAFGNQGVVYTDFHGRFDVAQSVALQSDDKILVAGSTLNDNNSTYLDFAIARYNADGSLDETFGTLGLVVTDLGSGEDLAQHITVQGDGKILVAGRTDYTNFAMARYNSDGTLDDSFGSSGLVVTQIPAGGIIFKTLLQDDNKILAVGNAGYGIALVRYNNDGSLDQTFGVAGQVLESSGKRSYDIALQSDGKILVAGDNWTHNMQLDFALMRYNSDGTLDTGYGSSGSVVTGFALGDESIQTLMLQPDGKALVAGFRRASRNTDYDFALARYNPDGSLDLTLSDVPGADPLFGPYSFAENGATYLNPKGALYDPELVTLNSYAGSTFTVSRQGGASPDDYFWAASGMLHEGYPLSIDGVTVGMATVNSEGILELSFLENATPSRVNDVMQSLGYGNMSDDPTPTIVFDWTFDDGNSGEQGDGGALSLSGNFTVNISPVNDAPELVTTLTTQYATVLTPFSYTFPELTFVDPDDSVLTYTVTMADGNAVPSWLTFDESTLTLYGTPQVSDAGDLNLRISATDPSVATTSADFTLSVDADQDGDGLSDRTEQIIGTNPALADTDGDGLSDSEELAAGTDPTSADTDFDGILDGVDPHPLTYDPTPLNDYTEFVKQVYRDFLSREADQGGLDYWVTQLRTKQINRAALVEEYLLSPEFGEKAAPVTRLYFAYFQRIPDYGGLTFWISEYASGHRTLNNISDFFAASGEFQAVYGSLDNGQFVDLIYTNLFNRSADAEGRSFWVGELDAGTWTRGEVMLFFSDSDEYRNLMKNPVYVTMAYVGLLRRSLDQDGYDYWVGQMDQGSSGQLLINGVLSSAEYAARF